MGVFPAASGNFLPETWRTLMMDIVSNSIVAKKIFFKFIYFIYLFVAHHIERYQDLILSFESASQNIREPKYSPNWSI